jgi:hypothetical protein
MTDSSSHHDALPGAVSGAEMMANLREIARWVKLSGTPEELEHVGFLRRRMEAYGYRTELLMHDAYISLPGKARVEVDGKALTAITHSFSLPSPASGLSGTPIYLGKGTEADYAGKDPSGRIVLLEGMATPAAAQCASRAGAAGQLHISHHEHRHEMCISPVWGSPSASTLAEMPRTVAATVSLSDGAAIRDALARGEAPVVTIHAEVDTGWRKTPILVAELEAPGAGKDDPFIMLSGHQDTWYHGVMDNGSANAGMMEAARIAALHRAQWKRGLRVCFWSGHSHGRYSGSSWYADNFWDELDRRCAAHVNVDSLGGSGASVLSYAAAMAELKHLAAEAVEAETNQTYKGKRKARNSDESFVGIGIPSMLGSVSEQAESHAAARNALGWWWHTPEDLIDKIDEANQVRDTRVLTQVLWRLLSEPVLPLSHTASAEALLSELLALRPKLGELVEPLVALAEAMREAAGGVTKRASGASGPGAARASHPLMQASRALVPVDYALGDRFSHPAALPLPAWAVLQPLRELAAAEPGSDAAKFRAVDALRARNRIQHALRQAKAALEEAAAALTA